MQLNFINQYKDQNLDFNDLFYRIINRTIQILNIKLDYSFSLIFVDNQKIQEINRDYRAKDYPTDVISFQIVDQPLMESNFYHDLELGDIFISIDKAKEQAQEYGHSFEREVCFLFTHGLLHILGFDHLTEAEEKEMFGLQDEILDPIIPRFSK